MAKIEIYTTPWCGYCARAKALLDRKGAKFEEMDVMEDEARRAEMRARSKRTTVPQIFINGRHIGGSDDLAALESEGKLDALLAQPG
jgi:glutaredoxin 3